MRDTESGACCLAVPSPPQRCPEVSTCLPLFHGCYVCPSSHLPTKLQEPQGAQGEGHHETALFSHWGAVHTPLTWLGTRKVSSKVLTHSRFFLRSNEYRRATKDHIGMIVLWIKIFSSLQYIHSEPHGRRVPGQLSLPASLKRRFLKNSLFAAHNH